MTQIQTIIKFLAILVGFIEYTNCQYAPTPVQYTDCSSVYCLQCLDAYQCQECATNDQPICCPKYCVQCLDMSTCIMCQSNFYLNPRGDSVLCARMSNNTDPFNNDGCQQNTYFDNVTQSCADCNYPNCQDCNSYQDCGGCNDGYYQWNLSGVNQIYGSGGQPQTVILSILPSCLPCMANCSSCSNAITCDTCHQSFYYNQNQYPPQCTKCAIQFCMNCIYNSTKQGIQCTQCYGGTFMNASTCVLCSKYVNNCTNCTFLTQNPSNITCTDCAFGMYLNGSFCAQCPANCFNCTFNGQSVTCNDCYSNWVTNQDNTQCIACPLGCEFCNNTDDNTSLLNCTQCQEGYAINYTNSSGSTLGQCVQCDFPCTQCYSDSNGCTACETGFFVNYLSADTEGNKLNIGQCYLCNIENCSQCSSATKCTLCEDGFYLKYNPSTNGYSCASCPSTCLLCTSNSVTSSNVSSTSSSSSSSSAQNVSCTSCQPGYALSTKKACVPCKVAGKNCLVCNASATSQCFQCEIGFMVLDDGTCQNCGITNCHQCNQSSNSNNTDHDNSSCVSCNSSYFLTRTSENITQCLPCQNNCVRCLNSTFCYNCIENFYLVVAPNKPRNCLPCPQGCLACNPNGCLHCDEGYFPSPIQTEIYNQIEPLSCIACPQIGCVSCINSEFCLQCTSAGYSTQPGIDGECIACPDGCILCNNDQECSQCDDGYLPNKQTNTCMDLNGVPQWAVFMICTFGMALLFVIVEKIVRRVLDRKEQKKKYHETGTQNNIVTGNSYLQQEYSFRKTLQQQGKQKYNDDILVKET